LHDVELKQGRPYKLGQTSVRLSGNRTREGFALVTCGNGFWHLSHVKDHSSPDYTLQKIWITDQNNVSSPNLAQVRLLTVL